MRWLELDKKTVPDGELTKLPRLETVVVHSLRNSELDVRGCQNLESLIVNDCRELEAIHGLGELPKLRALTINSCRKLQEVPDLSNATALVELSIGPLDVARTIAPAMAAQNLEVLELRGPVPLAPGDVELIRDHPTLLAFSWAAARVPTKVSERVTEIVGMPLTRSEKPCPSATPPSSLHDDGTIPLPAPLDLQVQCSMGTGWGGFYPVYLVGDIMLDGALDFGEALTNIEINLFPYEAPEGDFAESIRKHNAFRETLPEIRFRRSAGSALIKAASDLDANLLSARHESSAVPLFKQACEDVLVALEVLRKRLKSADDFDIDGFLTFCRGVRDRMPSSQAELDALGAAAAERRRRARQAEASALGFPGWMPGQAAPDGL